MLFALKKLLSAGTEPLVSALILACAGFALVRWKQGARWKSCGRVLITVAVLGFFTCAFPPTARILLRPLEAQFAPLGEAPANASVILILGHGHQSNPALAATAQLSSEARSRLLEGLRLARQCPKARLIASGYGGAEDEAHAEVLRRALVEQGIDPARISTIPQARDTAEEAALVQELLLPQDQLLLVTSAAHMPRSMALFRHQGLQPSAAPCHFEAWGVPTHFFPNLPLPGGDGLRLSRRAIHEYLGLVWLTLSN